MGKKQRSRWTDNVRCMEIVGKDDNEITDEDRQFLKESFTGQGGLIPNGFNGGQFLTPPRITKMIWDMMKPHLPAKPKVLEPSCGSGGFFEYAPQDSDMTGIELDKSSARIAKLIYPEANIINNDAIIHSLRLDDDFDLVIGNPPFGISIEESFENYPQLSDWQTLKKSKNKKKENVLKGKSENVFLELAIKHVKPGGYIAFILPQGIAFAQASENIRQLMYKTCWQKANIHLPGTAFQHVGTTVSTQILILRKVTPNAKMIPTAEKKWGSNVRSNYGSIEKYDAHFFQGQEPAFFAEIVDCGIDKNGNETDSEELEVLAENFNDPLVRENMYPHVPSWFGIKDNSAFFMSHGNGYCDGHMVAENYESTPYMWAELTLGNGAEYEYNGKMESSYDFELQDEIVDDYYKNLN